ncbi:MAG: polysaccharide biosynthesis protein [Actinomycetota bacterium]|nr:polysaccharide biosynthesis protein [Actinomycetota bacterium]
MWVVALYAAAFLRYEFHVPPEKWAHIALLLPVVVLAQIVTGVGFGLYVGRWRYGSFDEVAALLKALTVTTVSLFTIDFLLGSPRMVPLGATLVGGFVALALMGGVRYGRRLAAERRKRPSSDAAERVVIFGAGEGGVQVVTAMLRDPDSPYIPVAMLDDDLGKRNLRIMGVPVVGTRARIAAAAATYRAEIVLIAIPSADSSVVGALSKLVSEAGLAVKVLPSTRELFDDTVRLDDIRDVTPSDLLGRHEIKTNLESIAGYLTGRKVMVTGAGGSIGSELCRQLHGFAPAELIMVDRDESALHAVKLAIDGRALLDTPDTVLLCIRDRGAVQRMMIERRPHVVFHAAALKHLPMLEQYPGEAVMTNVHGTLNLLEAAAEAGVTRFVNVSTDKAADPISVLGYTKRLSERITSWMADRSDGVYLSVRFGNVLGSRGSVLNSFKSQIVAGGPLTVTHPDVERYFMTVEEAVQLVIQAGAIGRNGEVLVLDMGDPVRIDDVARFLADQAERPVEIVYTGLRKGEKLKEVLLGEGEVDERPLHPLISQARVPPLDPKLVSSIDPTAPRAQVIQQLARAAEAAVYL